MSKKWTAQLEDTNDGTGDAILPLPDELLADLDWKEGDTLNVDTRKDGTIVLTKK
jgi:hypothetical protein